MIHAYRERPSQPNWEGDEIALAGHADWARQQTMEECLLVIHRFDAEADDAGKADEALSRLASEVRHFLTPEGEATVAAL
jgi:hypothetical protein